MVLLRRLGISASLTVEPRLINQEGTTQLERRSPNNQLLVNGLRLSHWLSQTRVEDIPKNQLTTVTRGGVLVFKPRKD